VRAEQKERAIGFLGDDRVREHPALTIEPERIGQRAAAQVRRALTLQERRRVFARDADDRGVSWSEAHGHQTSNAQSRETACKARFA